MSYSPINPNLNQPMSNSLRQPRAIITINGIQAKWIDIEITTNHFYVSDTFMISLPTTGQNPSLNLNYWSLAGIFEVKIYIGFPTDPDDYSSQNLPLFMTGNVTDFTIHPVTRIIQLHGRDLSSRLIDKKLTQGYPNQTLSQIAELFALQNNLIPNVENTTEKVGIFYKNNLTILSNNSTQWDLLTALAQLQNFVVWVNNDTLTCIERPAAENSRSPYVLNYQEPIDENLTSGVIQSVGTQESVNLSDSQNFPSFNGMNLTLSRTPYNDVWVTIVVPYSLQSKKFLTVTATSTNRHRQLSGLPAAPTRRFTHKYFGLTRQQAQLKALQLLNSYLIHEFEIQASLPGDNLLLKESIVQLKGTNSEFDQIYYPDEITRRISMDEDEMGGYYMSVSAKSRTQQTVVVI